MQNFVQPGNTVTVPSRSGGIKSGEGMLAGKLFGVAAYDALEGADVELDLVGVFDLPKSTAGGSGIDARAAVYWDDTAKVVTKTAAGNTHIGASLAAAADGTALVRVRLNGQFGASTDVAALDARVTTVETGLATANSAISALDARVTALEHPGP
jgi:predicted RecA/RadA family phage recombinase